MLLYILIIIILLIFFTAYYFSNSILYPHRQPISSNPLEYGMKYEDIEFPSTDGLKIRGWLIPGKSKKTIIITHAMPFNRHGFKIKNQGLVKLFSTNVELLKTAKALNAEGYSIVIFDFRNHGESEKGMTAVGLTEYQDILGAMNFVRLNPKLDEKNLSFVSFCMGANATIIAMSKAKEVIKKIKCMVAIQPISMEVFVYTFAKTKFSVLSWPIVPLIDFISQARGGFPLSELSPAKFCKDINFPVLFVQAKTDPWTDLKDIENFYNLTNSEKEFWYLEERMGRFDAYNYVGEHPEKIIKFLDKYMK